MSIRRSHIDPMLYKLISGILSSATDSLNRCPGTYSAEFSALVASGGERLFWEIDEMFTTALAYAAGIT